MTEKLSTLPRQRLARHRVAQLARVLRALRGDSLTVTAAAADGDLDGPVHVEVDTEPAPVVLAALADADHGGPHYVDDVDASLATLRHHGIEFVVSWRHRCPHCDASLPETGACDCDAARAERAAA